MHTHSHTHTHTLSQTHTHTYTLQGQQHACILTLPQCTLSLSYSGSEGWDQMREGEKMMEEEKGEEGEGTRVGSEERRSDSRLLLGVPLTPSPRRCCSLPSSGGVSSGLRCASGAVPALVPCEAPQTLFSLSVCEPFTRGGLSCSTLCECHPVSGGCVPRSSSCFPSATVCSTSFSFHLFPPFTSCGGEQSSLAIRMGSRGIVCVFLCAI